MRWDEARVVMEAKPVQLPPQLCVSLCTCPDGERFEAWTARRVLDMYGGSFDGQGYTNDFPADFPAVKGNSTGYTAGSHRTRGP